VKNDREKKMPEKGTGEVKPVVKKEKKKQKPGASGNFITPSSGL